MSSLRNILSYIRLLFQSYHPFPSLPFPGLPFRLPHFSFIPYFLLVFLFSFSTCYIFRLSLFFTPPFSRSLPSSPSFHLDLYLLSSFFYFSIPSRLMLPIFSSNMSFSPPLSLPLPLTLISHRFGSLPHVLDSFASAFHSPFPGNGRRKLSICDFFFHTVPPRIYATDDEVFFWC